MDNVTHSRWTISRLRPSKVSQYTHEIVVGVISVAVLLHTAYKFVAWLWADP